MEIKKITETIIGCAIEVHKHLGPGLLESTYEACLNYELQQTGLLVRKQVALPIKYKTLELEEGYQMDFLIDNKVVVEIKAVGILNEVHAAQVLTYLKFSAAKIGLLINFNVIKLTNGLKRFIR